MATVLSRRDAPHRARGSGRAARLAGLGTLVAVLGLLVALPVASTSNEISASAGVLEPFAYHIVIVKSAFD